MFQWLANFVTIDVFGLGDETRLALAVNFFFYDVIKILILIFLVVSVIAFFRTFLVSSNVEKFMGRAKYGLGNLIAALFGAATPFCSCSSVPLFIGFLKARVPIGIAFSFLITSPLVNEVAFVIMGGLFGWKLAFLYASSGILLGVFAGIMLGIFKVEKYVILEGCGCGGNCESTCGDAQPNVVHNKWRYSINEGYKTFKDLLPYVLVGVAIGAGIHGFVPQDFFINFVGKYNIFAVPVAVLVGVPIYAGCSTIVPLIFSVTQNGVPLGTSLALMMSIAGLSLPEAVLLKRVMKMKLLAMFFGIVTVGIILIGYLFNFFE